MKYFAKYIVSSGVFAEGCTYQILEHGIRKSDRFPRWTKPKLYVGDTHDKLSRLVPEENRRIVKLFLCGNEITLGDDVITILNEECKVENGGDLLSHKINNSFKVIGEISTAAMWVKEGDEFEEGDVLHHHICYDDSYGGDNYCSYCQRSAGCDSTDYNYLIKGACGHFH